MGELGNKFPMRSCCNSLKGKLGEEHSVYVCFTTADMKKTTWEEFPGGPVVRTPSFHDRGHGFNPWWRN